MADTKRYINHPMHDNVGTNLFQGMVAYFCPVVNTVLLEIVNATQVKKIVKHKISLNYILKWFCKTLISLLPNISNVIRNITFLA